MRHAAPAMLAGLLCVGHACSAGTHFLLAAVKRSRCEPCRHGRRDRRKRLQCLGEEDTQNRRIGALVEVVLDGVEMP